MNALMIVAHPNLDESIANKNIAEIMSDKGVSVRNIMDLYPDYKVDIEAEQLALMEADTIIFQYPFYWYNMPAILKQWFDEVFSFNFAYGPEGDKLKGKNFLLSFTVGGPADSYSPIGYNHFRIEEFTKPMEQTAYLAQMTFLAPVYEHGMVYVPNVYNTKEAVEERAAKQADRLVKILDDLESTAPEHMINEFVKDWFAHFDKMADDGYFNHHLDKQAKLKFVEGEYIGHEGFSEWYKEIKKLIKPDNEHIIKSISINKHDDYYKVDLTVNLKADTYHDGFIDLNVKETWKVAITRDGRVKIHEYKVSTI
ncbi:NAD(P)H-dependent oxidoreductase [Aureibacter tunicatorum]|uniref:NADPH-quinone reductase n=1 Tax=Aureibacter tunicatorum TaxID=866807 RepID=A0AAE4BUH4_9BACT|nr:NAD(P)H-dependent oxidoreductase [Aureibacter tunicatorum]MDR6240762.1 putative NADPH-quinone reductase [Aureibacter tunicatorum]BDD06905.1 hypothetical protein AUTU_43880 [Aureibacter tunicatorum]